MNTVIRVQILKLEAVCKMQLFYVLQLSHFHSYDVFCQSFIIFRNSSPHFLNFMAQRARRASNSGLPSKLILYQLSHAAPCTYRTLQNPTRLRCLLSFAHSAELRRTLTELRRTLTVIRVYRRALKVLLQERSI
jgi:hypothetical protein